MEVFDVGTVPVDEAVRMLFEEDLLIDLLRPRGLACFILARPMLAREFYEHLIDASSTIDATTRDHIAFVVFYGNRSSLVHKVQYRNTIRGARSRLAGISISGDPSYICRGTPSESVVSALQSGPAVVRTPRFDSDIADMLRYDDRDELTSLVAHATSRATVALMRRFGILESKLPCVFFLDPKDPRRRLTVQLDPERPLESLGNTVLQPLSQEFADLSDLRTARNSLGSARWTLESKQRDVVATATRLARRQEDYEANFADPAGSEFKRTLEWRAALSLLEHDFGNADIVIGQLPLAALVEKRLRFALRCRARLSDISKMQQATNDPATLRKLAQFHEKIDERRRRKLRQLQRWVERQLDRFETSQAEAAHAIEQDRIILEKARRYVAEHPPESLAREASALDKRMEELRERGYNQAVLDRAPSHAYQVVSLLHSQHRIGFMNQVQEFEIARVLFFAANPMSTSRLDLEEELRGVERELHATKFREQIALIAQHAVRPDDLVRYVRSHAPRILHFSGHASHSGIFVRADTGGHQLITGEMLRRLLTGRGVQLVVLNACYTEAQAQALAEVVDAVVGTSSSVDDEAARRFSCAFYRGLGDGLTIREAFRDAGDAVALHAFADVYRCVGEMDRSVVNRSPEPPNPRPEADRP